MRTISIVLAGGAGSGYCQPFTDAPQQPGYHIEETYLQ